MGNMSERRTAREKQHAHTLRTNRAFALCYRSVAFILCLIGLLETTGVFRGSFNGEMLLFYTTETNLLVLIVFGILIGRTVADIRRAGIIGSASCHERLSAIVALSITVTMLIFWFLLAPTITDMSFLLSYHNLQIHLISPLLILVDFFFFATPGKFKKQDPWLFAIVPIVYFVQATILGFAGYTYTVLGQVNQHFPYFFIDFYKLGGWVFAYVAGIFLFFVGLAYLFLWYDRRRACRARRPR
jgi:hypothetical protein